MNAWIGVDPGARYTGVVGRHQGVATWTVIDREQHPGRYLEAIEEAVHAAWDDLATFSPRIAIENFVEPTPHMGLVGVRELIATAFTIGWLDRAFGDAVFIRPGGHGHRPWATYPPELITKAEERHAKARPLATAGQSSLMRHARSAYDVAGAAPLHARREASLRGARP
jgi:hypothetical protein